jgi:hypothetical protein
MIIFVSLVPKRRHISHKFYQITFVHCTLNHVRTAAGVWLDCWLETNLVCFEPTLGSCWEKTRQLDQVQCNRCCKQYSSRFMLPYLESAQTVVLCRFWLQCSHGLMCVLPPPTMKSGWTNRHSLSVQFPNSIFVPVAPKHKTQSHCLTCDMIQYTASHVTWYDTLHHMWHDMIHCVTCDIIRYTASQVCSWPWWHSACFYKYKYLMTVL